MFRAIRRVHLRFLTCVGLPALAACGGGGTEPPPPTPTIAVSIGGAVGLVQGQANSTVVTVTRGGGFNGSVGLSVSGLPAGVTGKFSPPGLAAGATTSTLTLTATLGAALGSGEYTVTASGSGVASATATGTVTVAEAPGFTMDVAPTTVTVEQGKSGTATVTFIRRGGFTGPIALTASNLPAGVTASFADPAPTGASTILTLAVGAGVATGSYPITVTGTGAPGQQTVALTLTVSLAQPVPSFTIEAVPAALSVQAGASGQVAITIARFGGFTGSVALSVAGQPAGVSPSFSDPAPTGSSSTLTLTVLSGVAAGTYPLTVRGTSPGLADQTANVSLTITGATGGFSLTATPTTVTIQSGQSGQSTITVLKTGSFTGNVTLAALNLPAGVTAAFAPPAPSPRPSAAASDVQVLSTLTLSVGAAVASANYPFVVRGSAPGQPDQSIPLTLVVNPPPGTGNTSFTFCTSGGLPVWFAYQNGGAWTRVIGVTAGSTTTYSFDVTGPTGGIAFVTGSSDLGYEAEVFYGTQAELQLVGNSQCPSSIGGNRTLTGSVAGLGASDNASVFLGGASESASADNPAFTLKRAPAVPADLFAVRSQFTTVGNGFTSTPNRVILRRGTNYPNASVIPVLDFSSEGFAPATATLTIGNLAGDAPTLGMTYETATTSPSLQFSIEVGGATQTLYGLPPAQQQPGELHVLTVFAGTTGTEDGRTWIGWFTALADRTVTLGNPLAVPTVTLLSASPYRRYQATGPIQAEYDDVFSFRMTQSLGDGTGRVWQVQASRAAFGGASYTLAIPDLSAVAGWNNAWALVGGTAADWTVAASGLSTNGILPPGTNGSFVQTGSRTGQANP